MTTSIRYTPTKRILNSQDEFFEEGNIALRAYWLERDAATDIDISIIRQEATTLSKPFNYRPIYCELPSCIKRNGQPVSFPSLSAYEAHYEAQHRYSCSLCQLPFPGAYWLQLHLDECHNVLNQIRKDRGDKIYECYVEPCNKKFSTPKMRRLHLIDKHGYPKFFPFDLVVTGTLSIEERQRRKQQHCRTQAQQHAMEGVLKQTDRDDQEHEQTNQEVSVTSLDHSLEMEIDALSTNLSKVKIPSSISFGRGRKQTWYRPHAAQQQPIHIHRPVQNSQFDAATPKRRERRLDEGITRASNEL